MILDTFSRYVVGWMLAYRESAELGKLIEQTIERQTIAPGSLTVHADRGVALLLAELGVTKTHSRPYVSNENPYSESQFKTMKYRPEFPERFGCYQTAHQLCAEFFLWYNNEHHHSGSGYLTRTRCTMGWRKSSGNNERGYCNMPMRETRSALCEDFPSRALLPTAVWINKPKENLSNRTPRGGEFIDDGHRAEKRLP